MNILLLDEPDVHLHPDLQARFARFLLDMLQEYEHMSDSVALCIATHSAPLVCAIAGSPGVALGTKRFDNDEVVLSKASDQLRKIAPFFGHPLSLTLNEDVTLIVEGQDDERVWQQASRSSQGRIRLFPVLATSIDQQTELENFSSDLLQTLYDDPLAFSVRDGDGRRNMPLNIVGAVHRYRLECYAIENMLLTDECLDVLGLDWPAFKERCTKWLLDNEHHRDKDMVLKLIGSHDRLRDQKIKDIRQLIVAIAGATKPWKVVVGQAIGAITVSCLEGENMLVSYVGKKMVEDVILRNAQSAN